MNASIGSRRYGVREVRHGPDSAEFSGDRRRCLSAHSATVRSSGGLKLRMAGAMAALSFAVDFLVVGFISGHYDVAPAFTIPHPPLIYRRIVVVVCELVQNFVALRPDQCRGFVGACHLHNVHG